MNDVPEWTSEEYLGNMGADELEAAMDKLGIRTVMVAYTGDGQVSVHFGTLADAEALMTLGVGGHGGPGSLYDRATSGCLTLTEMDRNGQTIDPDVVSLALMASWEWTVHPDMQVRRMGWHAAVSMTVADANQITVNLNTLRLGAL